MTNAQKLKELITDVFLIDPATFHFGLKREDVETWDSLGVVSLAVGVQETFGYHMTQEEALSVRSVADLVRVLESRGVSFSG